MRRTVLMVATMALTLLVASGVALAAVVTEAEPNNSIAGAQAIAAASFDVTANPDPDIANSTTIPHATVNGGGDATVDGSANDTFDYYSFTVPAGDPKQVILDIDHTTPDDSLNAGGPQYNPWIELYGSSGTRLDFSDDMSGDLDRGSSRDDPNGYDSLIETTLGPGTYVVGVGQYECEGLGCTEHMAVIPDTATYQLHVSVGTALDTTPPTVAVKSPVLGGTASKTDNVTATFSEEVQNVTSSTFILERKIAVKKSPTKWERVAATVSLIDGIYELNPVLDLPKGEYRATITTDGTDLADNALVESEVWNFTVAK